MKNSVATILLLLCCLSCFQVDGQTRVVVPESHHNHITFIENKKQWEERIRFKSEIRGGALFFENNAITYTFYDPDYLDKIRAIKSGSTSVKLDSLVTCYAYRMWFEGANIAPEIKGHYPQKDYNNYYIGSNPEHWSSNVKKYEKIEYKGLYPGIDLLFYGQHETYKYEFIVKKGSDPSKIRLRYEGVDKLTVKNNNLIIQVGKHETVERAPYAYQYNEKGEKQEVECYFVVGGKTVTFTLKGYDKTKDLIIDPTLIFASFSGSVADNWGYSATYDSEGNLYGGGTVYGVGYPVTVGVYQSSYGTGTCDIAITKFSSDGTQAIFATYLGGNGADAPHSLIVNDNNELYVLASTSSGNYPTTTGAYDRTFNGGTSVSITAVNNYIGGSDIAISRFNALGTQLLSSTFFGGSGNDGLNTAMVQNYADEIRGEIQVDRVGNIYVVSSTQSTNLPVTFGAFQTTYGGGTQDGFIAKFSADLQNLLWCSYFGGNSSDAIYSMELDAVNNIYICGGTQSTNLSTSSMAITPFYRGLWDGFVAKIIANGSSIMACSYFGTTVYDQVYLITLDQNENVLVVGQTDASDASWINNAGWHSGTGQFLSKLSNDLSQIIWSTSFGSSYPSPDISPTALMVDICDNIHISGWGGRSGNSGLSTYGLPVTNDALQLSTDGNDFYFMTLSADASTLVYASFFGGYGSDEHVDGGTSRFDRKGCIYQAVCAGCGRRQDFPTTPGVVSDSNRSYNCNLGVIKLDFNLGTIVADFSLLSNVVCTQVSIDVTNQSSGLSDSTVSYFWDFGDGTTDTVKDPTHIYALPGDYIITLIVSDSTSCNFADTIHKTISVGLNKLTALADVDVCKGDYTQVGFNPSSDPTITYQWFPSQGLNNYTISNPIFYDTVSRQYIMLYSNIICVDTFTQQVNVLEVPIGKMTDTTACSLDTFKFVLDTFQMDSYVWSSNPFFSDTLNTSIHNPELVIILNQPFYTFYLERMKGDCKIWDTININASSFFIQLNAIPKLCIGDTMQLNTTIILPEFCSSFWFEWSPSSDIIENNLIPNPTVSPEVSTLFHLSVTNEHGCTMEDSIWVHVVDLQAATDLKQISCYGLKDGNISISMKGGDNPYTYQWQHTPLNTAKLDSLAKGVYSVTITDSNRCFMDTVFTIIEPTPLYLTLQNVVDTVFCDKVCNGEALAVLSGGVPPYFFYWITGDTTPFIDNLCAGEYFLMSRDDHGCLESLTLVIKDTANMNVSYTSKPTMCAGDCEGNVQIIINQAIMPCEYIWEIGDTTDFVDSLCKGIYDVSIIDSRNCTRRIFPQVISPDSIEIDRISIVHPYCRGMKNGSISVHAKGGTMPYSYYWNGVQGTELLSNLDSSGDYQLKIIDANLCEFDTIIHLVDYDTLSGKYAVENTLCKGICVGKASVSIVGGVHPYRYVWNDGSTTSSLENLCEGKYAVTVYDSNSCEITIPVEITVDSNYFPKDIEAWTDNPIIYRGQSAILYGSDHGNEFSYVWFPKDYLDTIIGTKAVSVPEKTIIYTYTVSDLNGCIGYDTVLITVMDVFCEEPYVFVPNAFSPNGDGLNDILYVRGWTLEKIDFAIYDRWGERLFETKDIQEGWDGTFKGKACEPGIYVYYLDATCIGGLQYLHKGNVTLIR